MPLVAKRVTAAVMSAGVESEGEMTHAGEANGGGIGSVRVSGRSPKTTG